PAPAPVQGVGAGLSPPRGAPRTFPPPPPPPRRPPLPHGRLRCLDGVEVVPAIGCLLADRPVWRHSSSRARRAGGHGKTGAPLAGPLLDGPGMSERTPVVVIVGGGFGGLSAARALKNAPVQVVLIDRTNHHLFQPLLYQVAIATLSPAQIAAPIREVLGPQRNTTVVMGEVVGVDKDKKVVFVNSP